MSPRPAIRHSALLFLALIFASSPAMAQFAVVGSSIADGQAGVPLVDSVYITFNQKLPFNTLFTPKFNWEPTGHYQRTQVFLDVDRMSPRFRMLHEQNFDFSMYVFGVESEGGSRMQRPFAINYTTAPSSGSRVVSGSAQFGTRTRGNTSAANKSASQFEDLNHTVILLLDDFSIDEQSWVVRAAAAITASGTYSFDHVRDGVYYPVAFTYADDTGEMIARYGYYDPDGDYSPDPVTVSGGNVTSISLSLYDYEATDAYGYRDLAEARAEAIATDAVLRNISATVDLGGESTDW